MIRAKLDASLKIIGPVGDAIVISVATGLAIFAYAQADIKILALLLPLWLMTFALLGGYDCDLEDRHRTMGLRLTLASMAAGGLSYGVALPLGLNLPCLGWRWFVFSVVVGIVLFVLRKVGYLLGIWMMSASRERRQLLLVCTADEARRFTNHSGSDDLDLVGWVSPPGVDQAEEGALGTWERLAVLVDERVVHDVLVLGEHPVSEIGRMARTCEEIGVNFGMDSNFLGLDLAVAELDRFRGRSVLRFTTTPFPPEALVFKRLLDISVSMVGLVLALPILLLSALVVKLDDPSNAVLFRQVRSGLYGRPFQMWKFRTMVAEAETLKENLASQNEMTGAAFKISEDPRITRVGKWLRKSSVDELPQLWNVLVGDMSLVGPRPLIPHEEAGYERWQLRRLSVRPGITGLWQVSGRNDVDFDTWMLLDMQYLDNWTIGLDIRLLLKTIPVVFSGAGAS